MRGGGGKVRDGAWRNWWRHVGRVGTICAWVLLFVRFRPARRRRSGHEVATWVVCRAVSALRAYWISSVTTHACLQQAWRLLQQAGELQRVQFHVQL